MKETIIHKLGGKDKLVNALCQNLSWLEKSILRNKGNGSSAYRNVFGVWSHVYPETTGYIIPTLLKAAGFLHEEKWDKISQTLIDYLLSIQNDDGSFWQTNKNKTPFVFDSSQILLGLCSYNSKDNRVSQAIKKSQNWLLGQLNNDGQFVDHNFTRAYNPSYYSRIIWAILFADKRLNTKPDPKSIAALNRILNLQNENGSFNDCGFLPEQAALSHPLIYTLRGLWESGQLLQNNAILESVENSTLALLDAVEQHDGQLAGSYDSGWTGDYSFICAAGNAQLVTLLMKMSRNTDFSIGPSIIETLMMPLLNNQKKYWGNNYAIPSSIPLYGKYQRFKFTNWTQKFFCDALLSILS